MLFIITLFGCMWLLTSIANHFSTKHGYRKWEQKSDLEKVFLDHAGLTQYTITGDITNAPTWVRYGKKTPHSCTCSCCRQYVASTRSLKEKS
jgi:hypothetical protein